jgi:SPP1 family predicted phage head-tail adaptor
MTLAAGRLRYRFRLEEEVVTQNPTTGSVKSSWRTVVEHIPGEYVPMSAREFVESGATQAEVTGRVTIRYRDGVRPSMRLIDESSGVAHGIVGVLPDPKSGREYLTLPVKSGVGDGR